jgi:phosphonate degradation associated HDIG domain protein
VTPQPVAPGPVPAYDALAELFDSEGGQEYLGEQVSMAQHMLQSAAAARATGAPRSLVVAAVAHDVGHFTGVLSGRELMSGTDNHHEEVAASWLGRWFDEEVTEPVRLHVQAKRYLCAVDPDYLGELSQASRYTLQVQGGPMSAGEVAAFAANPYAEPATRLRRFDDRGKDPGVRELSLAEFGEDIRALDRTVSGRPAR